MGRVFVKYYQNRSAARGFLPCRILFVKAGIPSFDITQSLYPPYDAIPLGFETVYPETREKHSASISDPRGQSPR